MALTVTHAFVSGVADDPKAAAAGEVLPSHWNATHTVSGTRDILTANRSYFVSATGSDSNDGLTSGTAWATLTHAATFIGLNIDLAGLTITVNIGAGSFTGFGFTSYVGGGVLQFIGAGPASTTITEGPNDGIINTGECVAVNLFPGSLLIVDEINCVTNGTNHIIANYAPGATLWVGQSSLLGSITFDATKLLGAEACIAANGAGAQVILWSSITVTGGGGTGIILLSTPNCAIITFASSITVTGSFTTNQGFAVAIESGTIDCATPCTGAGVTGPPYYSIVNGGIFTSFNFPGSVAGIVQDGGVFRGP